MRLTNGQVLDGLRVVGTLGEGATSQVYLVADSSAGGELRALKLLSVVGSSYRKRLQRESEAIGMVRHPNVVSVHRMVEHEGMTGILMEFVAGPTVRRWLQTAQPAGVECLAVAMGVLRGLKAIHDNNLVHRDIKPGNIILATHGDGPVVPRLLDFGLVKHLGNDRNLTVTGASMGTPAYMAPEQLRDASKVDARADLYSLGCVLFEMIAGVRPFVREEWWDAYRHLEDGAKVEMHKLPAGTPAIVCDLLSDLLQPDPDDRPASAQEVIDTIIRAYPNELAVHEGHLRPGDAGGRVARGLALVQRDAHRSQDVEDGVIAEPLPTGNMQPMDSATPARTPLLVPLIAVVALIAVVLAGAALAVSAGGLAPTSSSSLAQGMRESAEAEAEAEADEAVVSEAEAEADEVGTEEGRADEGRAEERSADEGNVEEGRADEGRSDAAEAPPASEVARPPAATAPEPATRAEPAADPPVADPPALREAEAAVVAVSVQGDAAAVRLVSEDGKVFAVDAPLPPGQYTVQVRWQPGDDFVPGGQVRLVEGQDARLTCQSAFFQCRG